MTFLEKAIDLIAGPRKIKAPTFIKDFSETNQQLEDLTQISQQLKNGPQKDHVLRDIMLLKQGIEGERNVYYELNTSFLPSLCLHDIRLEYDNYIAQFDFIVITPRYICVLETKKLSGNITITSDGDFIRSFTDKRGRVLRHEGIYSPISQNERHIKILENILIKENLLATMPYRSLVVMANSKTIIDKQGCPKHIQHSLVRHDQLVNRLHEFSNELTNEKYLLEKHMWNVGTFLRDNNKPLIVDYIGKYNLAEEDFIKGVYSINQPKEDTFKAAAKNANTGKDPERLIKELKEYRLTTSRKENNKPYYIFDNKQMEDLIAKYPTTKQELLTVYGFGPKKVEKYGEDILRILRS